MAPSAAYASSLDHPPAASIIALSRPHSLRAVQADSIRKRACNAPHFFALENRYGCNARLATCAALNHALERFKCVVPVRSATRDDECVLNVCSFAVLEERTTCGRAYSS